MTYSILARDTETGNPGIAVQSKFPGVSNLVCYGEAGVGVVATQAYSNPDHGRKSLQLLKLGMAPQDIIDFLISIDDNPEERQLAILSHEGKSAQRTGESVKGWNGAAVCTKSKNAIAHGNCLASNLVPQAMVEAFEETNGDFAERLIAGLQAGQDAGGEIRGVQSAGLQIFAKDGGYEGKQSKLVDIPVYDHSDPIGELARCYKLHKLSYFPSKESDLVKIEGDIASYMTKLLIKENYIPETDDNSWNKQKIDAMAYFMGVENYDNRIREDAMIDVEVLEDIKSKRI